MALKSNTQRIQELSVKEKIIKKNLDSVRQEYNKLQAEWVHCLDVLEMTNKMLEMKRSKKHKEKSVKFRKCPVVEVSDAEGLKAILREAHKKQLAENPFRSLFISEISPEGTLCKAEMVIDTENDTNTESKIFSIQEGAEIEILDDIDFNRLQSEGYSQEST